MNVTLWDTSSDVRKELSIQDDRTESDNRIEVMLLIGIAENNLPHIARWESTKPPYAEPHVRWCGRSVNVKIGGKCLLWLAFTSYPILRMCRHFPLCPCSRTGGNAGVMKFPCNGCSRWVEDSFLSLALYPSCMRAGSHACNKPKSVIRDFY